MDGDQLVGNDVVAVVQARTGSTRLPGKVLYDVGGVPLLERVLDRVQTCETIDRVLVATSNRTPDDAVAWFADDADVGVVRGDEQDVLARYHKAARQTECDTLVRLTADNPLVAPEVIDTVVRTRLRTDADYCSTAFERTFPEGIGAEAFTPESLERVHRRASTHEEREHVTPYYRTNAAEFETASVTAADVYDSEYMHGRTDLRLTLDTPDDYAFFHTLFDRLGDVETTVPLTEVVESLEMMPLTTPDV